MPEKKTLFRYRIKRLCEWQFRLWDPERDHDADGSVTIDVAGTGTPPHHFEPLDDGPVGPSPKGRSGRRAVRPSSDEPATTLQDVARAGGKPEQPATPAATNKTRIANRVAELKDDSSQAELFEMAGPDGLALEGAKANMNKTQLATGIARHEHNLEPFGE